MNNLKYSNSTLSRRRIAAVFLTTAFAVILLIAFGVYPLQKTSIRLNDEISELETRINSCRSRFGRESLDEQVKLAQEINSKLEKDWQKLSSKVATFNQNAKLEDVLASSEEGRIDYKVALYDARQRIGKKSDVEGIEVPADLGMEETIGTDEVMESKLWQLAANVYLTERLIEKGIQSVNSIEMLDPVAYLLTAFGEAYMLFYPVRIQIRCTYSSFLESLHTVEEENGFYAIQRLLVRRADTEDPELLEATIVCSALLFREELPRLEAAEEEEMVEYGMGVGE